MLGEPSGWRILDYLSHTVVAEPDVEIGDDGDDDASMMTMMFLRKLRDL